MTIVYPKRLIEVDLPIKRISEHARREKSIRHGHISTLHIWWARRPLASCRAVILAALWPDPADPLCPERFLREASARMKAFRDKRGGKQRKWDDPLQVREALLDFIADFANWDNSNEKDYLETSCALVQVAHESLGGAPGTRPLVVDPFAGGGAIPLEALRVGADAFASDINPVPVLLNRVMIEYMPRFGQEMTEGVRKWGAWIATEALKRLKSYYPADADGAQPVTYLWARNIRCEGPDCGAEVPLLRSLWLAKRGKKSTALRTIIHRSPPRVEFEIVQEAKANTIASGTSKGGAATCPVCGYTTPVESVRTQLTAQRGGARTARLIAVLSRSQKGRVYRLPTALDLKAVDAAVGRLALQSREPGSLGDTSLVPDGEINHLRGFFNIVLYGNTTWGDLFSPRQLLALTTLCELVRDLPSQEIAPNQPDLASAIRATLALVVDRVAVRCTANCIWDGTTECIMQVFNQGQALPARWEFAEMCPALDEGSGWTTCMEYTLKVLEHLASLRRGATVRMVSATHHPLPDDSADVMVTDPPYYAAIPYADLSDFFYSWLKRSLAGHQDELLASILVQKDEELVSLAHRAAMYRQKNNAWFENQMSIACREARRVCVASGLSVWVFANKETAAWEAMLSALISAGWIVTASWAIDTESGNRLRAKDSASLASSVHIVCRPREATVGPVRPDLVGDWRDVLAELPKRIHSWMPRLAEEGVVGADAIFACLGPALEIFSRYSRVEKASGDPVPLKEYLEQVWAAVAKEALAMIFAGADATGFEEDARLTAMWLWTLSTGGTNGNGVNEAADVEPAQDEDEESASATSKVSGFVLEYDAARKIAQGLGANLEALTTLIHIKGSTARLLPVAERTRALFGKDEGAAPAGKRKKKPAAQLQFGFAADLQQAEDEAGWGAKNAPPVGKTVLDRLHQAMILFAAGRSEALRRFLVDEGVGRDDRLWRLAQALSALYPATAEEKRWVDGVLARKKGLGL